MISQIIKDTGLTGCQLKKMGDHFGEAGLGDTYAIHGKFDQVIYNAWRTKEPNYVMGIMATGGKLLEDDTCKDTVRKLKENG